MQIRSSTAARAAWLVVATLALAACGGKSGSGSSGTASSSSSSGTLGLAASATSFEAGGTSDVTATLTGSAANGTVTWALSGVGALTSTTGTTAHYVAPAAPIDGTAVITVTATSTVDSTLATSISMQLVGNPVLTVPTSYPANLNVAYSTTLTVTGGTSPYTWTVTDGTLPPGLTFGASTSTTDTISGTPTSLGSYEVGVRVTDNTGRTTVGRFALTVRPQDACALEGDYTVLLTGHANDRLAIRAAHLTIDADGKVTGVEDLSTSGGAHTAAALTSATCKTTATNHGTLALTSAAGSATYAFATLAPLGDGRLQEIDGTGIRGTGSIQHAAQFASARPAGDFAFGLTGLDGQGRPLAIAGRFTTDANGAIAQGRADVAGAAAASAASVAGTFDAADATGRGTATVTIAGTTYSLVHYANSPDRFVLAAVAANGPRLAGWASRQTTPGAFGVASLSGPAIFETWAVDADSRATTSLGRLTNAASGSIDLALDAATAHGATHQDATSATLAVDADGRAVVAPVDGSRRYVIYLDSPSSGYLVETVGTASGLVAAQSSGPYETLPSGVFVANTQFARMQTTLLLAPALTLDAGAMSNPVGASYVVDAGTGRGAGTATTSYFGGAAFVIYTVTPDLMLVMGSGGTPASPVEPAITWLLR